MVIIFFLKIIPLFLLLLRWALLALIFLFFISFASQWRTNLVQDTPFKYLLDIEHTISKPIDPVIQSFVPSLDKIDFTDLVKIIFCLVLFYYSRRVSMHMRLFIKHLEQKEKLRRWQEQSEPPKKSNLYAELEEKLDQVKLPANKKNNAEIYKEIAILEKELEGRVRYFAFLSIDVVNSVGMKVAEKKSVVQMDFLRYKHMIENIFNRNACINSTWTPDGTMACFNFVDNAVNAAQQVIRELKHFNQEIKQISKNFKVRCGIHAGTIQYDEKLPLEEVSDQIIDIAGHMQKNADPDSLAMSRSLLKLLDNSKDFINKGERIDDLQVYQWSLKTTGADEGSSLKMTFLGTGSAFTIGDGNFHSNVLLEMNRDNLLIDAGSDLRFSLNEQKKNHLDIRNLYITHMHGDHVGGLEWLALNTYFDEKYKGKPTLFAADKIIEELWEQTLAGGLRTLATELSSLETYFNVHPVKELGSFKWQEIDFKLVQMVHVFNGLKLRPCYGLLFECHSTRILYTADTQFVPMQLYREADIIFHDCETAKIHTGVHTHYTQLLQLPKEIKKKMWLYHYNPGKLPDATADGFLGFVTKGQCFIF
jgi:ribonuclease BN (tRNA processing enzyme)/class 3 adenylate cyclase